MEVKDQALTCPICVDVFTKPIGLPCGHSFCQSCIRIVWNEDDNDSEVGLRFCPECQIFLPPDLKLELNTDLEQKVKHASTCGHVSEETALMHSSDITCDQCIERTSVAVKSCLNCDASLCSVHTLHHQHSERLRGHTLIELTQDPLFYKCQEHGEEQKLFCQDDQVAVCCLCVVFGTHKGHRIIQLQEACSDFKKALEERDTALLKNRHQAECALQDLQRLVSETSSLANTSRVRIAETYSQIKDLIVKDQQLMMDIIEMEEFYTNKWLDSKRECLEQQITKMDSLLSESKSFLQEKNELKLLKNLKRHTFWRLWANMKEIHLDADTAHPNLEVSEDLLEVRWSKKNRKESKDTEHISTEYSILAKESLLSGSHYWETAVWEKPYWLIGLSCESNTQAGEKNVTPDLTFINKTFCYIYHGNGRYLVCNGSQETMLAVEKKIQKVGVSVEIEKGTVSFYDADTMALLHLFAVEFPGPVRPLFNPCLCLNEQNAQALILIKPERPK
ncbi:E3 ubiquitin-protein ligase TRIM62-like [Tachysurus vachellii]|uniref:E3 ubiquitin-protein ligase TRIM62-like n=1 Tax=Tachysurus vachellii TaxID=175792 RepID=UPI00296AA480|nr:E3 ubiquitin-protein ligase TRIM62-like [Tachysurus vachellii]